MKYSAELVTDYSNKREQFNETDNLLLDTVESLGIQDNTVLDLGCGDGRHAETMKEMGAARVIGMDINEKMIDIAKERLKDTEGLNFLVATGTHLPFEDASMDKVFSNFVVHYFTDSTEIFDEISRVLKDEGYFVGTFNVTGVEEGFERLYNTQMPIRLGHGEGSIVVQNLIKSRKEIDDALEKAGLKIIQEQELDHPNATVDDSFPEKAHITKKAIMFVLQKQPQTQN